MDRTDAEIISASATRVSASRFNYPIDTAGKYRDAQNVAS
jgi:hypothetical protein